MLTYTSRTPSEADIEAIFQLYSSAYPYARDNPRAKERFCSELSESTSFLCLDNGTIIGHISVRQSKKEAMISRLLVDPNHRRQRIGQQLSQCAVAQFEGKKMLLQGTPLTHHSYTQQIFLAEECGFHPTKIHLAGAGVDLGAWQIETLVYIAKLCGINSQRFVAYVPLEYQDIAQRVLQPFCDLEFGQLQSEIPTELEQTLTVELEPMLQYRMFPLNLDNPFAPTAIAYVQSKGYYCAGFSPRMIKGGQLTFAAYMARMPEEILHRDRIKVIPAVQPLFDFVWQQYEARK
jgi:GNAT superfamily N-acetyltransferase